MNTTAADRLMAILEQSNYTIHCEVTHVAQSGMSRDIVVLAAVGAGEIRDISNLVIELGIGHRTLRKYGHGVRMGGCGMDMTHAIAYDLGRILYDDGYKVKRY